MQRPKLILAPVDFSAPSGEAVEVAADYAARLGAELLLVHAVPAIPKLPSASEIFREAEYEEALRQDAQRRLETLAQGLAAKGVHVGTEIGIANDVGMEILRIAEHHHVDLIVIATHGMTGWHKLVFGSVAEKVVRLATCPVLVLRGSPKAGEETSSRAASSVMTR
jgi:nucleotide-binding universal stress UspA family protein